MEKKLKELLKICKENKVEININPDGIGLWTTDNDLNLRIYNINPSMVKNAISNLNGLRVIGWKQS